MTTPTLPGQEARLVQLTAKPEGRCEQLCLTCGRDEAGGAYCTWCGYRREPHDLVYHTHTKEGCPLGPTLDPLGVRPSLTLRHEKALAQWDADGRPNYGGTVIGVRHIDPTARRRRYAR